MSATSTSRIGRKPVTVPAGVEVKLQDQKLSVKGPKGQLSVDVHPFVHIAIENNLIKVQSNAEAEELITGSRVKLYRSIVGTMRANIHNVIHGVTQGFERKLALVG